VSRHRSPAMRLSSLVHTFILGLVYFYEFNMAAPSVPTTVVPESTSSHTMTHSSEAWTTIDRPDHRMNTISTLRIAVDYNLSSRILGLSGIVEHSKIQTQYLKQLRTRRKLKTLRARRDTGGTTGEGGDLCDQICGYCFQHYSLQIAGPCPAQCRRANGREYHACLTFYDRRHSRW